MTLLSAANAHGIATTTGSSFSPQNQLISSCTPQHKRADFDGDCKTDISVFNQSAGYWNYYTSSSSNVNRVSFQFGQSGDIATPGDYNGDGTTDPAVFRPGTGTWYIATNTTGGYYGVAFGQSGDIPVARDYDGDGTTDIAVFRPSNGYWYILNSSTNSVSYVQFGQSGDRVVPDDYDNDGNYGKFRRRCDCDVQPRLELATVRHTSGGAA